jgi:serine/threonine protein kinase
MAGNTICPRCGSAIGDDAPAGLCPKCLLEAGFANSEDVPPATAPQAASAFDPRTPQSLGPLFPQLEILSLIGRGGMGAVYKARQPELDRLVAVKILPEEVGRDPAFAERFYREARALARLSHQNIVSVYDFGQTHGLYYFVMEYVDGTDLRQLLQAGSLQPETALAIVPQICEALQFAHDEGIVHRDIKPENILIDKRGRVKIADYGLAKLRDLLPGEPTLTVTRQVMGTPRYMAPEQMRGASLVDHRADIYSLGVVFYEMLTGDLPLGHFAPPSHKAPIDARLDQVVFRALAQEPQRRYQCASEVKTDVDQIRRPGTGVEPPIWQATPPIKASAAPVGVPSRFSRKAILGACWAPLFFLAVVPFLLLFVSHRPIYSSDPLVVPMETSSAVHGDLPSLPVPHGGRIDPSRPPSRDRADQVVVIRQRPQASEPAGAPPGSVLAPAMLLWALAALGVLAPFGTTILGIVAISDIRQSQGRLRGLGLAVCDALVYPLLVLDLLILLVTGLLLGVGLRFIQMIFQPGDSLVVVVPIVLVFAIGGCIALDILIVHLTWRKVSRVPLC